MPRLTNALPSYRKHRASGQAVVTLGGADHYLGKHGSKSSRTLYDRLVAEWLANGRSSPAKADDPLTVVELCSRYLKHAKGYYRKNGRCTGVVPGIKAAIKYLREWYGREPACDFGPVSLKGLRNQMIEDGHSRRYINDHLTRIKRMFEWAAGEELVPESTYSSLALVEGLRAGRSAARETAPVLPVDDSIVDATLEVLSSVVGDMVRIQRFAGMRPAEVCSLRPCDLDRSGWTRKRGMGHRSDDDPGESTRINDTQQKHDPTKQARTRALPVHSAPNRNHFFLTDSFRKEATATVLPRTLAELGDSYWLFSSL